MLVLILIVILSLATIHFSHVLLMQYMFSEEKLSPSTTFLRPLSLCVMAACAQYYILSMITGYNLPEVAGLALVATNAFFFVGFYYAYKARVKSLESKKHS